MPIRTVLVGAFVLVAALAIGFLSVQRYLQITTKDFEADLAADRMLARAVALGLNAGMEPRILFIHTLAQNLAERGLADRKSLQRGLDLFRLRSSAFDSLAVTDRAGVVAARTPAVDAEGHPYPMTSYGDRPWFQSMSQTPPTALFDVLRGKVQSKPTVPVTALIRSAQGEILGTAIGTLNLDRIREFVTSIGRGQKDRLVLVDSRGRVIAHPSKERERDMQDLSGQAVFAAALRQEEGSSKYLSAFTGQPSWGSFARVASTGWIVWVVRGPEHSYAKVRGLFLGALASGLLALAIAAGAALVIATILTRRLNRVASAAREISAGTFRPRALQELQRSRILEVDQLGRGLRDMATALETAYAVLETRVAERTRELATEVTERRRAEEEARRASGAKSDFLSRMSHELRTPLNAVIGFAQLLEMGAKTPDDRESVDQILRAGRHLLALINEVLDLARIESGRVSVSLEPVHVRDVLARVLDLVRPLAEQRQIEMRTEGEALLDAYVRADNQRLQQVLLNLASNGIKYNHEGGRLTLAAEARPEARVRITVTDTGPGIPPALTPQLFTPFERLGAEQRGIEGTGLGLALCKGLVEAMDGTVGVESVEGRGSTFWVEFLRAEAPIDRQSRIAESAPVASREKRSTILYIEDNLSNLRLLERVLAQRPGIALIPAMQGTLGLELARQHRPDLVLLDLHLPGMSGEEVFRQMRADANLRHIPVIVLSADASERTIERLLEAGARAYLAKPLNVRQLLAMIDETFTPRKPT